MGGWMEGWMGLLRPCYLHYNMKSVDRNKKLSFCTNSTCPSQVAGALFPWTPSYMHLNTYSELQRKICR